MAPLSIEKSLALGTCASPSAGLKLGSDSGADLGLFLDLDSSVRRARFEGRLSDNFALHLGEDRRGLDVPLVTRVEVGLGDCLGEGGDGSEKDDAEHFELLCCSLCKNVL